jgi:hypothetical protein
LADSVRLRKSHFFPAAAYKLIRAETIRTGFKNPNPVRMTDLAAVQTSEQYAAHLLCNDCEQRFHAKGENWVLQNCWRGSEFRLLAILANAKPEIESSEVKGYYAAGIPDIDVAALAYFAASMFWRAAIHNWSGRHVEPPIDFGPYTEELRKYLKGTGEFPKNCVLCVTLPTCDNDLTKMMRNPYPVGMRGIHIYTMLFLGIGLSLFVGRQIPPDWRELDFVNGYGNPIVMSSHFEDLFRHDLHILFRDKKRALSILNEIEG